MIFAQMRMRKRGHVKPLLTNTPIHGINAPKHFRLERLLETRTIIIIIRFYSTCDAQYM